MYAFSLPPSIHPSLPPSLPSQTRMIISTYTASRDERWFKDPDEFKPERWNKESWRKLTHFLTCPSDLVPEDVTVSSVVDNWQSRQTSNFKIIMSNTWVKGHHNGDELCYMREDLLAS